MRGSAHDYFRFINVLFAGEVCCRFDAVMATLPTVNLHGDAHIEQIAKTPGGTGLGDFDDSASGPPVIDLVCFGVSIELTLAQLGWAGESTSALDHFLDGYRAGLRGAPAPPPPQVVVRIGEGIESEEGSFLEWAESRMGAVSGDDRSEAEEAYMRYVALMLDIHPDWEEARFALKRWGLLSEGGIGSATTKRYLARIEGASLAAEDGVIIEAKELRDLQGVPCVIAQRTSCTRWPAWPDSRCHVVTPVFCHLLTIGSKEKWSRPCSTSTSR